jgi:hypothetical protein
VAQVLVAKNRDSDPHRPTSYTRLWFGGEYFFLYPDMLRLRDETGELIDPQTNAFFVGLNLDALSRFVESANRRLSAQPEVWVQRVGVFSTGEAMEMRTSRTAVQAVLDGLSKAVQVARETHSGVLILGE